MEPISRRRALQLGALGTAGVVVGGWGLARQLTGLGSAAPAGGGGVLGSPPELRSRGDVLEVELEAAPRTVTVGGERVTMLGYADGASGPTLRLRPGDRLAIRLRNRLEEATNLHVHGLHVSPEGNGDNPFVTIEPGEHFDYSYQLPGPPGRELLVPPTPARHGRGPGVRWPVRRDRGGGGHPGPGGA